MTDDSSEPGEPKLAFTKVEWEEVMPTLTLAMTSHLKRYGSPPALMRLLARL